MRATPWWEAIHFYYQKWIITLKLKKSYDMEISLILVQLFAILATLGGHTNP